MVGAKMELVRWDKDKKIVYLKKNGALYKAKVLSYDQLKKTLSLYIFNTNETIELPLGSKRTTVKETQSPTETKSPLSDRINAPISGRVIQVFVADGEQVKNGAPLLSIESMKMENMIRAPFDLFLKTVHIAPGNLVKQDQLLCEVRPEREDVEDEAKYVEKKV